MVLPPEPSRHQHLQYQNVRFRDTTIIPKHTATEKMTAERGFGQQQRWDLGVEAAPSPLHRPRNIGDDSIASMSVKLRCDLSLTDKPKIKSLRLLMLLEKYTVGVVTSYIIHSDIMINARRVYNANVRRPRLTVLWRFKVGQNRL